MGSERIFLWVCRGSLEFFFLLWVGFGVLLQNLCKPNVKANRKVAQPTWGFGRSFDWFTRLTLTAAHFISRHNQDHTKAKKKNWKCQKNSTYRMLAISAQHFQGLPAWTGHGHADSSRRELTPGSYASALGMLSWMSSSCLSRSRSLRPPGSSVGKVVECRTNLLNLLWFASHTTHPKIDWLVCWVQGEATGPSKK